MTPVFANSAWVTGPERFLMQSGRWRMRRLCVRYGVFVHPAAGPVLIDTGYAASGLNRPDRSFWLGAYARTLAPEINTSEQPGAALATLGLELRDIGTVIVTHFHADHVSGLAEIPNARFVASGTAWKRLQRIGVIKAIRHGVFPELLPADFAERLDPIEAQPVTTHAGGIGGHDLFGDGRVLAVPLPGHADGHFGLLFAKTDPPLLYGADAQWLLEALVRGSRPRILPRLLSTDYGAVASSSDLVAAFRDTGGDVVLCHDDAPTQYDLSAGARL
ncbi:MAG: MBL fold metallo-hydrolase [Pseudomonadota bacterium]